MTNREIVLQTLGEICGVDPVTIKPEDDLFAQLGLDSPKILHLLVKIEDRFDVEIRDEDLEGLQTVGDVLTAVDRCEQALE